MPTPHGSRGGMAFSADEVRVLRRALAQALHPAVPVHFQLPDRPLLYADAGAALWAEDVQDALRLTEAIDEAVQEGGRLRAFLLADLTRYRAALPGSASGYLERLEEAVTDGYLPGPEDLTALRGLSRQPCGQHERSRRSRLAGRCHALAEAAVRERLALTSGQRHLVAVPSPAAPPSSPLIPVGGRIPMSSTEHPAEQPAAARKGAPRGPQDQRPARPHRMPTPAELFGRRPKAAPHPDRPVHPAAPEDLELATGTG
ncbi:hypothetical protein [Kitasatospora purpeofusca]|uniref:hypothetical protein n=1 Tax=Kitasatospora purpeofusca TaxID=67352 RepID=UPI002256F832|nr:hypothetical protein [Kitasatospora purpeofusca]MCX4753538.1 hypothetical protein [Kitasatospora purpeofusca]WSR33030.1 hypothetical protein OG715_19780 [Kitasatospora purpeofusca]WSR41099.1 hypothetical protein OG196_19475 [Kitasatospora purpeofusca]